MMHPKDKFLLDILKKNELSSTFSSDYFKGYLNRAFINEDRNSVWNLYYTLGVFYVKNGFYNTLESSFEAASQDLKSFFQEMDMNSQTYNRNHHLNFFQDCLDKSLDN